MVKTQNTKISHLPPELILNILSRLPLTSLLQSAKCTCKLWRSVVDDPIFPDMHFTRTLNNPHGYLYVHSDSIYFTDNPTLALKLPGDLGDESKYECIASCRGLVSYRSIANNFIYVCNPILGDHVKLPSPEIPVFQSSGAFGYATLTKQYKYLQFSFKNRRRCTAVGKIFVLGEESWRDLAVPQNSIWTKYVYCNGALYWILGSWAAVFQHWFMSFDLDTEKFRIRRIVPIDNNDESKSILSHYLTVLGETVAFVIQTRNGTQQVWMLVDEAGNVWIEKYRLCVPTPDINLLGLWMNQDFYGTETTIRKVPGSVDYPAFTRCISYNVDLKTYTEIKLPLVEKAETNTDADISLQLVISHVGSLLSPLKIAKAASNQSYLVTR